MNCDAVALFVCFFVVVFPLSLIFTYSGYILCSRLNPRSLVHFEKFLIFLYYLWQVSQLEIYVRFGAIHRPLVLMTFHLSCSVGVRFLPPAMSLPLWF